ncbi:MAG: hypothetical protein PF961_06065 [Planctomycetota bacterium]|jgi:hypothetical protein|nr:hypothetical protein [Planctomycetota bacterium]
MDTIDPASISDDSYCQIDQHGHLSIAGKRARFWAIIGSYPYRPETPTPDSIARAYRQNEALVERFTALGFNMSRFWRNVEADYQIGDGSEADIKDHFLATMKRAGFRIWYPGIAQTWATPNDVDLIDEPSTSADWRAAIAEIGDQRNLHRVLCKFDARSEAAQIAGMRRKTDHRNRYTGLRVGDDPLYAIFELTNEDWWMSKMVGGMFRKLPTLFRAQLQARWTSFLKNKYANAEGLTQRWGFLLPNEGLDAGTVGILPLRGAQNLDDASMDEQARQQLLDATDSDECYGRDDFNRHRGEDVLEFFVSLHVAHKKRLEAALKGMGKACRLCPTALDTGIGYEIQSQWLYQNGDVSAHDAYVNGLPRCNPGHFNERAPWMSGLEEAPRICHDVPWLEHNKIAGKPFLCYETQIQQPAKFRAEFPFRMLALASIQDWDAICWHYWGGVEDIVDDERPFDRPLDYTTGRHPQGYHYTYDAVQNAAMRVAGHAFRGEAFAPAPEPTTFIYGRRSLYDPASMDVSGSYGKHGLNMLPTVYQRGVRIEIDPSREDDAVIGEQVNYDAESKPGVFRPTDQIRFDTRRGGLVLDSAHGALFTGFLSRFGDELAFANNACTLRDVAISIDPGMPYSEDLAEDRYIAFGLVSTDGLPLTECHEATLCLVSSSFNTGFTLACDHPSGCNQEGSLPVLHARVRATLHAPALAGMRYVLRGWHLEQLGTGTVDSDGLINIGDDIPLWQIEFVR